MRNMSSTRPDLVDGNTALQPTATPRFVLLEGGAAGHDRSRSYPEPRWSARETAAAPAHMPVSAVLFVLAVAVVLGIALTGLNAFATNAREAAFAGVPTASVSVCAGDSLWGLASEHAVDGASTQDVVKYIEQVNGLDSATIVPGETLIVPSQTQG